MKRFFQKLANAFRSAVETVKIILTRKVAQTKAALTSAVGEGYVDSGVKIIIAVVVGGVLLAGLYALFKTTILPNLNTEIGKMFNYSGT